LWWLLAGGAQPGRVIMGGWLMSVREKILGAEARWVMGRVMAGDFFDRPDARLVTTVMCSWDTNRMRAIDPAVSGLRAERTSLLSLGDDQCRFAVAETGDPLVGYTDKIEQRFAAKQESA
jgi:hypothetical protein